MINFLARRLRDKNVCTQHTTFYYVNQNLIYIYSFFAQWGENRQTERKKSGLLNLRRNFQFWKAIKKELDARG